MKKILIFIFLIFPLISMAEIPGPPECCKLDHDFNAVIPGCVMGRVVGPPHPRYCPHPGVTTITDWGTCCFLDSIYTISDWLAMAFIAFALIIFAIGAYHFLFSGGDPAKIESAKNYFFWGSIGVILLLFSKLIPALIKAVVV